MLERRLTEDDARAAAKVRVARLVLFEQPTKRMILFGIVPCQEGAQVVHHHVRVIVSFHKPIGQLGVVLEDVRPCQDRFRPYLVPGLRSYRSVISAVFC